MPKVAELSLDAIIQMAPSIATDHPHPGVSSKYVHIKTLDILPKVIEMGWVPVRATQAPVMVKHRQGFQKHMVTLRRRESLERDLRVDDDVFEAHLTNSLDRSAAWCWYAGMFVMVCSNGLVVSKGMFAGQRLKHINISANEVIANCLRMTTLMTRVIDQTKVMKEMTLTERQRLDFAEYALIAKYENMGRSPISPTTLLTPRRVEDEPKTLWKTFNVIQENIMRGGQREPTRLDAFGRGYGPSCPINKMDRQVLVNQILWERAESLLTTSSN